MNDRQLLQSYLATRSHRAFAAIVRRHISLVYSVARRHVRNPHDADDITQSVFALLVKKAPEIPADIPLAAWLHQAARFTSLSLLRDRARRQHHETEAAMNTVAANTHPPESASPAWPAIAHEIDAAVEELPPPQRIPLILRFFAGKTYPEIGAELALSEDTARKRVDTALERLRETLSAHSLSLSSSALSTLLLTNATQTAPASLTTASLAAATSKTAALFTASKIAVGIVTAASVVVATLATIAYAYSKPARLSSPTPLLIPIAAAPAAPTTQTQIVTTAPAAPAFQGWVQINSDSSQQAATTFISHINTATCVSATYDKSLKETSVTYQNAKTGEFVDYHASTDLVRIGMLAPDEAEFLAREASALPISYAAVTASLRQWLNQEPVGITHAIDEGLDRYDFAAPIAAARKIVAAPSNENGVVDDLELTQIPTAIWVDPATHLTRRATINGNTTTYTYGGPDIASIYDAGAPRTAKVYDNRPNPATVAVLDRIRTRSITPLPDGVSVILDESEDAASISVHEQLKGQWQRRQYTVRSRMPDPFMIDLPADWAGTETDEFFRRLAGAASRTSETGDGADVRFQDFTVYSPAATQTRDGQGNVTSTVITKAHYKGQMAKSSALLSSPAYHLFFFRGLLGQFKVNNHVALVTDSTHPGLINIRYELRNLAPDSLRAAFNFWFDPAHGDRPVEFTEESFEEYTPPKTPGGFIASTGRYKSITTFSDSATLPDGRQYAGTATTIENRPEGNGGFTPVSTRKTTFHFFPNRTLPPLKIPATQPANLP